LLTNSDKGNANQNIEIPSTPRQMAIIKKTNNKNDGKDERKKKPLYTVDRNVN
jgi:hypothetical protein